MLNGVEREQKILDNVGLVKSIMKTVSYTIDEADDVLSEGMIGLIQAVDRFDPGYDVQFSTYAYGYIRGKILDYFNKRPFEYSLDDPIPGQDGDDTTNTMLDTLESSDNIQQSYEDEDIFKFRMNIVNIVLGNATENQANAYRLMLGGMSYADIGKQMDISVSKVKQLISVVDRRLNYYIIERGLNHV